MIWKVVALQAAVKGGQRLPNCVRLEGFQSL